MSNHHIRIIASLVISFLVVSLYSHLSTTSLVSLVEADNIKGLLANLKFPTASLTKLFTLQFDPTDNKPDEPLNNNSSAFNLPTAPVEQTEFNYAQPTQKPANSPYPSSELTGTAGYPTNKPNPTAYSPKIPTSTPKLIPTKVPKPTSTPKPQPITSDLRPGTSLYGIFEEVSKRACFPTALLKAIQYMESGSYFKPTDSSAKIKIYNTYGWWINGTGDPCTGLGYSFQTGIVPPDSVNAGIKCKNAIGDPNDYKIMGITSVSEWEQSVAQKYITGIIPKNDRRVLFDNALMFAYISRSRIPGSPPKDCNNWPDDAVKTIAEAHSGTCDYSYSGTDISGNYCKQILDLYKKYKKEE